MVRHASIAEARADLSALVNRVAHGRERIILTSRGRPKAALVGLEDLGALEELAVSSTVDESALVEADQLVERISRRRQGAYLANSADDLAAIREGER
ncbi:MAG: type II toxin-antitoxin system Phd/YefM family antitoxin [Chloroflexi bacterium]|nr:type II toxin-antitoxin system Phd/YefM family antitoxin [Chloroflexota bacterium]